MKNLLKIAALSSFAFFMASCGSANDVYGNSNSNNGVYRSSDGTVYRQGEIYRDRNGNVYQNGRIVRNYPATTKRLPPGQAKKIYGGSAKDYAPGQVKKRNAYANSGPIFKNDDQKKYKRNDEGKFENKKQHHKKGPKKGKHK